MTHGAIEWIEIPARDPDASAKFYEGVFGWKIQRKPEMEEYPMFMAGEHVGGGFTKSATPMSEVGILLHISVDDIDASLAKVKQSGGSTIQEKKQITPEIGWWAIFRDPAGNSIGLYQSARKS